MQAGAAGSSGIFGQPDRTVERRIGGAGGPQPARTVHLSSGAHCGTKSAAGGTDRIEADKSH